METSDKGIRRKTTERFSSKDETQRKTKSRTSLLFRFSKQQMFIFRQTIQHSSMDRQFPKENASSLSEKRAQSGTRVGVLCEVSLKQGRENQNSVRFLSAAQYLWLTFSGIFFERLPPGFSSYELYFIRFWTNRTLSRQSSVQGNSPFSSSPKAFINSSTVPLVTF